MKKSTAEIIALVFHAVVFFGAVFIAWSTWGWEAGAIAFIFGGWISDAKLKIERLS